MNKNFTVCASTTRGEHIAALLPLIDTLVLNTALSRTIADLTRVQRVSRDNAMLSARVLHLEMLGCSNTALLSSFLIIGSPPKMDAIVREVWGYYFSTHTVDTCFSLCEIHWLCPIWLWAENGLLSGEKKSEPIPNTTAHLLPERSTSSRSSLT